MSNFTKIIDGTDFMLFLSSGGTRYPLAFASSASLQIAHSLKEIQTKNNPVWAKNAPGKMNFQGSSDALIGFNLSGNTVGFDDLLQLHLNRTELDFSMSIATGSATDFTQIEDTTQLQLIGKIRLTDVSINANDGENATYSISFTGNDILTFE